jgi:sugar phosphate isomerase/epimerase
MKFALERPHVQEIGIAGWAFYRSILREKKMTLIDLPAVCKELGVETIELVSTFFESQTAPYLNGVREAIEQHGLKVRNIAVDTGNLANADERVRRTDIETIKQWFHVARAVGSEAIRVNSGAASPDDGAAIERIIAGYRELTQEAQQNGVYLLIENHGGASADPKNIKAFLEQVGSPWFRSCPDTANFPGTTWEEGMLVMAPYAFTTHIKAWSYDPQGLQSRIDRDGNPVSHDLKRSLQILKDAGYAGPLNVEYGASDDEKQGTRDTIAYVKQLLTTL